jgi:alpha-L-fucosidase
MRSVTLFPAVVLLCCGAAFSQAVTLDSAQRRHIELRYGALMHLGMNTFIPGWGNPVYPSVDTNRFNPRLLDCAQWARVFKAAKMTYGVLTCKHHDGFCLWPSAAQPTRNPSRDCYSVAMTPLRGRDIVAEYANAFRAESLEVGIYYSMWDASNCGWGSEYNVTDQTGRVWTAPESLFITTQITELMSNYGEICMFMVDGWDWTLGHRYVPYSSIRRLVKSLQPNRLMVDMNCLMSPWEVDMVFVEEPKGWPVYAPPGNVFPMCQSPTITGGWFARDNSNIYNLGALMSQADILQHLADLEPRYCNLLLNVPPDTNGLITPACSTRIMQVAAS